MSLNYHRLEQRASYVAHFLLHGQVVVELGVGGGVRLPITDVAVELARSACALQTDGAKPIGKAAAPQ